MEIGANAALVKAAGITDQLRRAMATTSQREEILEPDLPIIDPHHHLWVRPGNRYLLDDFLADAQSGHNIKASVFVECGSFYRKNAPALMAPVGEVEFANGVAAMAASGTYGNTLVCAGIVGTADLRVGADVAQVLDAQIAAGGGRFRGIRFITKWDADEELNTGRYKPPPGLMQDRNFRAGFAELAPRKLSFDAMIYHPQIPELAELARAFPDTTIVLNHIGGLIAWTRTYLARKDEAIAQWRSSMAELAKCPNVYVKLGGLGMSYLGLGFDKLEAPASSERARRELGTVLQALHRQVRSRTAACSRAISRRTGSRSTIRSSGTPSSASPPGIPLTRSARSSMARRRKRIG